MVAGKQKLNVLEEILVKDVRRGKPFVHIHHKRNVDFLPQNEHGLILQRKL